MKTLLIVLIIIVSAVAVFAQQETANPLVPQRKAINGVRHVGDWTWFTMHGTLYRKHVSSPTAEVWYRLTSSGDAQSFEGLLLNSSQLAYHRVMTPDNSRIPLGSVVMRLDPAGTAWFSDTRGTDVSFDGEHWMTHAKGVPGDDGYAPLRRTWGPQTPFYGDSIWARALTSFRPCDELLASIPAGIYNPIEGAYKLKAVFDFDVMPNGDVILLTLQGAHVFRPLNNADVKPGEPLRAANPYPNPAGSSVTFSLSNATSERMMSVEIRDLVGRTRLLEQKGSALATTIDVTGLDEGVYVAVLNSEGITTTTRFVVAR